MNSIYWQLVPIPFPPACLLFGPALFHFILFYSICLHSLFSIFFLHTEILTIADFPIFRTFPCTYGTQNMMEAFTDFLLRKILQMVSKWLCILRIQYLLITRIFAPLNLSLDLLKKKRFSRYPVPYSLSLSLSLFVSILL